MRRIFPYLCWIPVILLVVAQALGGNFNSGGPQVAYSLLAVALLGLFCPVLTLIGIILIFLSLHRGRLEGALLGQTIAAALPGIVILVLIHRAHGPN